MIKNFVAAWDAYKDKLEEYIKTHEQKVYSNYEALVKLIFEHVINPHMEVVYANTWDGPYDGFDINKLVEIDHGNYQGTLLYVIPFNTYQPSAHEYVYTFVEYGSCSGCDTLQGIHNYDEGIPSESQVKDYMELCLHLLQNCHWLMEREK